jgi:hypothetical protein
MWTVSAAIQSRIGKDGEISLSDRIHLGAIKDGFGLLPVDHLSWEKGARRIY